MPSTINGIGTWYYGKKSLETSPGTCEFCHQHADLKTYETRLWFVFFFVPVIPLGKKQILDECSLCRRHRALPLTEWERLRSEAVDESAENLEDNREDPEAGLQMLGTLIGFRKNEEATKLARLLKSQHVENAQVQFTVGGWLEHAGHSNEATECFQRSFELEPEKEEYKRAWGITLSQRGDLDEAHRLLEFLEPPSRKYDPGSLLYFAQQCQKHGDHERTLEVMRKILKTTPVLAKEKWIRKLVQESELAIGSEQSILPRRNLFKSQWFWTAAVLLLAAVGIFGWSLVIAATRTVIVVNGSDHEITVVINGDTNRIPRQSSSEVAVGEGTHKYQLTAPDALKGQGQFTISTSFIDRFTSNPCYILDPGKSTIVIHETAVYAAAPAEGRVDFRPSVGDDFYSFPEVDFGFHEQFPDEIQLRQGQPATRTRANALLGDPAAAIGFVSDRLPTPKVLAFCERHLQFQPPNKYLLDMYAALVKRENQDERYYEFMKSGANREPIDIQWHRRFQESLQRVNRFGEMQEFYQTLLEKHPADSSVLYLRGRIESDMDQGEDFFRQSVAADEKNPWPLFSLTFRHSSLGKHAEARQLLQKAIDLDPENDDYRQAMFGIRLALGEYEQLEAEQREQIKETPLAARPNWQLFRVLARKGDLVNLKAAQKAYTFARKTQLPSDPFDELLFVERFVHYSQKDFEKVLELSHRIRIPRVKGRQIFQALLDLGRLEELEKASLPDRVTEQGYLQLFVHLAWLREGNATRAEDWLNRALANFRNGDPNTKAIAAAFNLPSDQDRANALRKLSLQNEERMLVSLAAAAQSSEITRQHLINLAESLNYDAVFPRHFMEHTIQWMRSAR